MEYIEKKYIKRGELYFRYKIQKIVMNFINLSNIKIKNDNIKLEFLYKSEAIIEENTEIYLEDKKQEKYIANVKINKKQVNYTYKNQIVYIAKVLIDIPILEYGELKIFLKDTKGIEQLEILNNKEEATFNKNNPYIIFFKQHKIQILQKAIIIDKKKFGEKLKYELNKQIYGFKKYKKIFIFRFFKSRKRKYYLFNDRLLYGDDNAEQLFKYINKEHPKFAKRCYFILDKKSTSIKRMKKYGKVLKYGSFNHKLKFLNSRIAISSHASYLGNCFNPFGIEEMDIYKDIINKKFVFLQHGVTHNDVSEFLNRELILADLFITSTNKEYECIKSEDYMYEDGMIVKTGMPRFDRLKNKAEKIILISPTWRNLKQEDNFETSEYFKTFKSLLTNKKLLKLLKTNGYKIKFLLHPVFTKNKYMFEKMSNEYIEVLETSKIKYFELFNECSIFITDYSSIHFDVAILKKPIIYYQFDRQYFFSNHYKAGYFDYNKDGFGKVVENENDVIDEIEYYLNNNCEIKEEYKFKIENTFTYLDNNNSQRVFEEIVKIDNNEDINYRFNNVH